ncbi:MAG: 1-deoxy-D-xylulose-5-phosphate reductoisomerase [Syntrophales bacterium]|nr:1-deoxy-D-xylulose-5-phosphate reductoisomerase [Syntrophales bacterium]
MKRISILGSTGSIGRLVLEIVSQFPQMFRVEALAAGRNIRLLKEQVIKFSPRIVSVLDEQQAHLFRGEWCGTPPVEVVWGEEGYRIVAAWPEADMVFSAMVGAAGLLPTWEAVQAGKDVALANKETLVVAGELIIGEAKKRGGRILPVDSEHSAIFQCLKGEAIENVKRVILTASGGPFLNVPLEKLKDVTPAEALHHPNWRMGQKITVDSATMFNKALEIIEARWLFSLPPEKIDVVIHPQSIVHSLVEFADGSFLAQMGQPDMKIPISYALFYPVRAQGISEGLDFTSLGTLTFLPPDREKFPCLGLAKEVLFAGGVLPAVMNAANEVAVQKFLAGRIRFTDIYRVIREVINSFPPWDPPNSVEVLLAADQEARRRAFEQVGEIEKKR